MGTILYDVIVQPIIYLIELVFSVFWRVTGSPGLAIVGVSIAVNLLCLPLYRMADEAQDAERAKQASMKRWVDHINANFKGDERYMMLSAYYTEQGYHPMRALVSSLSLLLQIPFFMAAYSYLSHLALLQGASFLFLADLGAPDQLLHLGGMAINVLPVVMTLLNCVSTAVYTRGLPLRDKAQAYLLAALFLWLLYDSPSGLVFYWTCNQVFSLLKNIFMKVLKNPRRWALAGSQVAVFAAVAWLATTGGLATTNRLVFVLSVAALFELGWFYALLHRPSAVDKNPPTPAERRTTFIQFGLAALMLTCLLGVTITSAVVGSSATEFVRVYEHINPLSSILHATCVWAGTLILWAGTYFVLSDQVTRTKYAQVMWCLCGVCLANYFAFGRNLGTISSLLVFDYTPHYELPEQLINAVVVVAVATLMLVLWRRANHLVQPALTVLTAAVLVLAAPNIIRAVRANRAAVAKIEAQERPLIQEDGTPRQLFHLSRTGQNVVVVFMDRAISGYVPFALQEHPEIAQKFDGFTYYPNTLSHGWFTNFGAPGLYGGYEYVPSAMNVRADESLAKKHDEALLLLPTLFSAAGYQSTVVDPPYAGTYNWFNDLSIYDGLANVDAVNISGAYTPIVQARHGIERASTIDRRFFCYGLFKVLPEALQEKFYDNGNYLEARVGTTPNPSLMDNYSVLELLPELTEITDGAPGFVQLANCTSHEPDYLQLPDYTPAAIVDNTGLEAYPTTTSDGLVMRMDFPTHVMHYHVNMATLLRLGDWFDWLREQGVYDNTRIIVVSDHGRDLAQFEGWGLDEYMDLQMVNPLFMVKDFGAHGFTVSDEFMTNADTPTLALEGVVADPVNPFTGVAITADDKNAHPQEVTASRYFNTEFNCGNTFDTSDAPWYTVHDNIFDFDNWQRLD